MPDEFRGIRPKNYSGQNYIAVNHPHKLVAFSRYSVGTPYAAGTLPGGGTYTQAAGTNQTEETVQTSASTVARWSFVANLPRIGYSPAGRIGLWRDPPRTNDLTRSDPTHAAWVAVDAVKSSVAGPSGATEAAQLADSTAALGYAAATVSYTAGVTYVRSAWLQNVSGTGTVSVNSNDGGSASQLTRSSYASWARWASASYTAGAGPSSNWSMIPANAAAADSGSARFAMLQREVGEYASNYIPTAATSAARAGSLAALPLSSLVRAGRLRFRQSLDPLGAADKYAGDGAAVRLWTIDSNTYAEIATATRVLTVVVNGVARVAGVAVGWSAASCVEWSWEVGGGALRVRYRLSTDAGVTWTLPFDPFGGTMHTDAAISTVATSLHTLSDGVSAGYLGAVEVEHERLDVIPSWVLQALPSDVASVKAFFRADGGITLNGATVSAWGGQTATAVTAFTQGTAGKQPAYTAAGFATARPSLTFDGAGDGMNGPTNSTVILNTTHTIYVLWRPSAFVNDSATAYANDSIVSDTGGAAFGIFGRANTPRFYGYNYDGTIDVTATVAAAVDTTYVLRLRHIGSSVYLAVNGVEGSGVASGNQPPLGAGTMAIGHGYDGARYAAGRMGALVSMQTDPTAAEDAAIMSFLNTYGGL